MIMSGEHYSRIVGFFFLSLKSEVTKTIWESHRDTWEYSIGDCLIGYWT